MIEQIFIDLPQFNVYHNSVNPIAHYYKEHINSSPSESEINKLLPYTSSKWS